MYDAWSNILTQRDLDNSEEMNLAKENPYRYAGYRFYIGTIFVRYNT